VWHAGTGRCQASLTDKANPALASVRFTPNGKLLLTCESTCWAVSQPPEYVAAAPAVSTAPAAAGCAATLDSRLLLWDPTSRKVKKTYGGHLNQHSCLQPTLVAHSPNTKRYYVACGSEDHHVYLWHLQTKEVCVCMVLVCLFCFVFKVEQVDALCNIEECNG
jgi:COMPASS component SWD3